MSFQEQYEANVALYKQRLGEVQNLMNRQARGTAMYDPDRRVDNVTGPLREEWERILAAPRDVAAEVIQEANNPYIINMVLRNQRIYNLYQRNIETRAAKIDELKRKLDEMKVSSTIAIQNPTGLPVVARTGLEFIRPSHSYREMYEELQRDRFNQTVMNVMADINIPENLAGGGGADDVD